MTIDVFTILRDGYGFAERFDEQGACCVELIAEESYVKANRVALPALP